MSHSLIKLEVIGPRNELRNQLNGIIRSDWCFAKRNTRPDFKFTLIYINLESEADFAHDLIWLKTGFNAEHVQSWIYEDADEAIFNEIRNAKNKREVIAIKHRIEWAILQQKPGYHARLPMFTVFSMARSRDLPGLIEKTNMFITKDKVESFMSECKTVDACLRPHLFKDGNVPQWYARVENEVAEGLARNSG